MRETDYKTKIEYPTLTPEEEAYIQESKTRQLPAQPKQETKKEEVQLPKGKAGRPKNRVKRLKEALLKRKREKVRIRERAAGTKRLVSALAPLLQQNKRRLSPVEKVILKRQQAFFERMRRARSEMQFRNVSMQDMRDTTAFHNTLRNQMLAESELKNQQLSENTKRMLDRVREIQTRGQRQDDKMQRVLRERRILQDATDLMKTPSLFDSKNRRGKLDFSGVSEDNILFAPNIFREREDVRNMLRSNRFNILQTKESGNNLKF